MTRAGNVHNCAARGCGRTIPRGLLMCRDHWFQVSRAIQREVYRTYANGAGVNSAAYHVAVKKAVDALDNRAEPFDARAAAAGDA